MAYPSVDAAYGFKPINELNGLPYAGAIRQLPIARNYGTAIFNGDLVELIANGTVVLTGMTTSTTTTARAGQVGIFVGCSYTNPTTGQKQFAQYYPGNVLANDIMAFIVDDDRAVFKAVMIGQPSAGLSNTATTVGFAAQSFVGNNVYCVTGTAGSANTGNSAMGVSGDQPSNGTGNVTVATGLPFRDVGVVPETAVTLTGTGSTSGSSTTVTLAAAVTGLQAGMQLICPTGTGSLAGNYITVTNVNGTTVTVSSAITLASGSELTFVGFPEVLVKWNQGYHSYAFATGI
jgi:hypothetical protein